MCVEATRTGIGLEWMLGLALMMQSPYSANGDKFPWLTQDTFVSGIEPSQGPAVISILNKLYVFSGQQTSGLHFKVKTHASSCRTFWVQERT